jgi:hypothetical protein
MSTLIHCRKIKDQDVNQLSALLLQQYSNYIFKHTTSCAPPESVDPQLYIKVLMRVGVTETMAIHTTFNISHHRSLLLATAVGRPLRSTTVTSWKGFHLSEECKQEQDALRARALKDRKELIPRASYPFPACRNDAHRALGEQEHQGILHKASQNARLRKIHRSRGLTSGMSYMG